MAEDASLPAGTDIEARQDELLRQLDELNFQVERALAAMLGERRASQSMAAMVPNSFRRVARAA